MNLNKTEKIFRIVYKTIIGILVITLLVMFTLTLTSRTSGNYIIFNDTNEVEKDVILWKVLNKGNVTQIPIKTFTKLGMEYFCNIELLDSTIIVEQLEKYDKISYEIIRYHVWEEITSYGDIEKLEIDTIYFKGLKVYNIEPYTTEKLLTFYKDLYLE